MKYIHRKNDDFGKQQRQRTMHGEIDLISVGLCPPLSSFRFYCFPCLFFYTTTSILFTSTSVIITPTKVFFYVLSLLLFLINYYSSFFQNILNYYFLSKLVPSLFIFFISTFFIKTEQITLINKIKLLIYIYINE